MGDLGISTYREWQRDAVRLIYNCFLLCVLDASQCTRKALHLAATLILISAVGAADCPEECVCMWKNGKETTECINRDKDSIPQGIEPSTQASRL